MKEYEVNIYIKSEFTAVVEAENEDEAEDKAVDMYMSTVIQNGIEHEIEGINVEQTWDDEVADEDINP